MVVLLAAAGSGGTATTTLLAEVIGGIAIGVAAPAAGIWLERGDIGLLGGEAFAALALFAARPIALGIALLRSELGRRERLAAAWFGPKGFASVVCVTLDDGDGSRSVPPRCWCCSTMPAW